MKSQIIDAFVNTAEINYERRCLCQNATVLQSLHFNNLKVSFLSLNFAEKHKISDEDVQNMLV